jgi:hypothetical protein
MNSNTTWIARYIYFFVYMSRHSRRPDKRVDLSLSSRGTTCCLLRRPCHFLRTQLHYYPTYRTVSFFNTPSVSAFTYLYCRETGEFTCRPLHPRIQNRNSFPFFFLLHASSPLEIPRVILRKNRTRVLQLKATTYFCLNLGIDERKRIFAHGHPPFGVPKTTTTTTKWLKMR